MDDVSYIDGRAHEIFTEAVTKADNDDKAITRQDTATDALMALLKPGKPVLKQTAVAVLSSDGHAPRTIERVAQQLCHDGRVIIRKPTPDEFPDANRNAAVGRACRASPASPASPALPRGAFGENLAASLEVMIRHDGAAEIDKTVALKEDEDERRD